MRNGDSNNDSVGTGAVYGAWPVRHLELDVGPGGAWVGPLGRNGIGFFAIIENG